MKQQIKLTFQRKHWMIIYYKYDVEKDMVLILMVTRMKEQANLELMLRRRR